MKTNAVTVVTAVILVVLAVRPVLVVHANAIQYLNQFANVLKMS
ncbi:MAG: hypothetical protein RSA27_03590 [Oscillospiraceae bacterium]